MTNGAIAGVPLEGLIDFGQERERLSREREKSEREKERLQAQLANPDFVERAPVQKVEEAKLRVADLARHTAVLSDRLERLS